MKLYVHFDGVLGFVPSLAKDGMTVILVHALRTSHGYSSMHHGISAPDCGMGSLSCVPSHYPIISFSTDYLEYADERTLDFRYGDTTGTSWAHLFRWEDLCVVRQATPFEGLEIEDGRRPGTAEPVIESEEENDFSWLSEMSRVDPELGEVDPACLLPDPPRNRVIGRMRLDTGRIFTDEVAGHSSGHATLWEFKSSDGAVVSPLCQALAATVVWESEFEGPTVTLRLTRFGPGNYSEIYLKPLDGQEEIHVYVQNLPLEGILGIRGGEYDRPDSASHFPLLARIAKKQSCRTYFPSPVSLPGTDADDDGTVRGGTTICIGGTFSG